MKSADAADLKKDLLAVPGIGPWTADYIALRSPMHADSFPKTDLILKRALTQRPGLDLEKLSPWRSYAAIYLWKEYLDTKDKP